ncbi:PKD domain-containing protein, partial [Chloroflexota bacterium]
IMNQLNTLGSDVQFGVMSYMDYPHAYDSYGYAATYGWEWYYSTYYGDYAYSLDQAVNSNIYATSGIISGLTLGSGGDGPQDYTRIMYESYADPLVGWRSGAKRILINFGDNVPHDNDLNQGVPATTGSWSTGGDPGRDEVMFTTDDLDLQTVLAAMDANGVTLIESHSTMTNKNYWDYWTSLTGGAAYYTLSTTLVDDIVDAVTAALTVPVVNGVHLEASPGYESWLSTSPTSYDGVIPGGDPVEFDITITVPVGTLPGTYTFYVGAFDGDGVNYGYQRVVITVPEPNTPPVADAGPDQTVEQTSLAGTLVTLDGSDSYDEDGDELTYEWGWLDDDGIVHELFGEIVEAVFPLGETTVALKVDDGNPEGRDDDLVVITVVDTIAPVIVVERIIEVEQETLEGSSVQIPFRVKDTCDADVEVTVEGDLPVYPLGDTVVTFTATDDSGNVAIATTIVSVVDTTAPEITCEPGVNPHGKIIPGKNRDKDTPVNPDGFYLIGVTDVCDAAPVYYVSYVGAPAGFEPYGPFDSGTTIKLTQAPGTDPSMKPIGSLEHGKNDGGATAVYTHITVPGEPIIIAIDASGNETICGSCIVPPPIH